MVIILNEGLKDRRKEMNYKAVFEDEIEDGDYIVGKATNGKYIIIR